MMSTDKQLFEPISGIDDSEENSSLHEQDFHTHEDVHDKYTGSEYEVTDEELPSKSGNYVFTVGNVDCGKSTLQTSLVFRLWSREDIHLDFNHAKNDQRHDALLHKWIVGFKNGFLPDRTKEGRLQEFNIAFGQEDVRNLEVNFLEISGEDIKSIVPTSDIETPPKINRQLVEYLKADKGRINKRFIFVSDSSIHLSESDAMPSEGFTEDILFDALLKYLLGKQGLDMQRINVLFVAAKWDETKHKHGTIQKYCHRYFPQSRSILNSGRCHTQYIPFSIGSVGVEMVDGQSRPKVLAFEARYIDLVIQWIYHSFTGNQLKNTQKIALTLWDKVYSFLSFK